MRIGSIGDPKGGRMGVNAVGDDAVGDGASRGDLGRRQQADEAWVTMMERQHGVEEVRDERSPLTHRLLAVQ